MSDFLSTLHRSKIVAVIRSNVEDLALNLARCVARGGVELIEFSSYTPGLDSIIPKIKEELPRCKIGTGTLTTKEMVRKAIEWGSEFLFSPVHDQALISEAKSSNIPIVAGAATPTEVFTAWQRGSDAVKVFPIANLGGASYIKALRDVFPTVPLLPTGGVTTENAQDLIKAGAVGVGISTYLFPPQLIKQGAWEQITDRAIQLTKLLENSPGDVTP